MSDTTTTLTILDGDGQIQTVLAEVNTAGNLTPHAVIAIEGTPVAVGTPLPTADAAADAALGNPADAIYPGSGSGSMISLLKGILATNAPPTGLATAVNQAAQLVQESSTAAGVGSPADTAWTSGSGTLVALLKATVAAINAQSSEGNATAALQTSQLIQLTATASATGTQADTAWTTGSGSQIALLKAVVGALTGTQAVSDATSHTTLASILAAVQGTLAVSDSATHTAIGATNTAIAATNTALAGTLNTSDATSHTSLATIVTETTATVTGIGGVADTAWSGSGSASSIAALKAIYGKVAGTLATNDATGNTALGTIVTETTASAVALGTPADVAWTSGNGTAIALLKKIAAGTSGGGAVTTVADTVIGAAAGTGMFTVGGAATTAAPTYTTGDNYPLSLTTSGALRVSDPLIETAATTQGATPGTGLLEVGGIFNTTLPTLTTGQASKLQLDSGGRLILGSSIATIGIIGAGTNTIGTVLLGAGAAAVGSVTVSSSALPTGAATSAIQATQQTSLTTIAAAYVSKASAGAPPSLVGVGAESLAALPTFTTATTNSIITDLSGQLYVTDNTTHASLGAPADTAWVSGNGSAIAILKTIASASSGAGGATAANQATQITQETASATALGTPADVAWTTGSGSTIALLKAIATDISGTLVVHDANLDNTYAAGQATAPTGELIVGGIYNVSVPTLTSGQVAQLQLNANGYLRVNDVLMDNTVAAQGAAPAATNTLMVGGLFNTTPPTLTTGQAGRLQIDATGGLILGAGTKSIGTVVLGAGAAAVGSVTVTTSALPTGASTSAIQTTMQTSLTAIQAATAVKGAASPASVISNGASALASLPTYTTATINPLITDTSGQLYVTDNTTHTSLGGVGDTAWTSGNGSVIAVLKAIASATPVGASTAANQATQITQETATATGVGTPADTAWTTGSGSMIAILKTIAGGSGGGGATAANQATQITQETATATATGTVSDTAWVSGNGTVIALLKKIAAGGGGGGGAVTTGADQTSATVATTGLFAVGGVAAATGPTLTAGDAYALSLTTVGGAVRTADLNVANTIVTQATTAPTQLQVGGGVFTTALPTLTTGQAGRFQLTAAGLLMTADQGAATTITTQAATPGTGLQMIGGTFNTTPPTLTTGQAGKLTLDSTGGLILGTGTKSIGSVTIGAGANIIGAVNVDMGGVAVSSAAPLAIKEFKGQGGMVVVPAGSTNGTAIGTLPAGSNGVRIYLKPTDGVTFTIQTTAPSSAPTALMAISGNITGPNWDEPLASTAMIYVTVLTGTPTFRFI